MSKKFEKLLDYLVNEEIDKASQLFHEIVVEKSRDIYESLIADDSEMEEMFGSDDEDDDLGGDASDDLVNDTELNTDDGEGDFEFGGDDVGGADTDFGDDDSFNTDGGEPATKDDISDLTDALDELKAEFQALLAGEKHEEENEPGVHGGELDGLGSDDGEGDDMDSELPAPEDDEEEEEEEEEDTETEAFMREYREIVGKPYSSGKVAGKTEDSGINKSSVVSKATGRPTTSATAGNIAQASKGADPKAGAGGLVGKVKGEFTGKHLNKVGGFKGDAFTRDSSGHGAEKKGTGEKNANSKAIVDKKF